jgi:serine phosphatase RsbU (regulator of sigma subunit)
MRLGLRAKSALAFFFCLALVVALAAAAGWRALKAVEENLGGAFARNVTQLNKQRILTPFTRELALSQRLAESETTRQWLLDEANAQKRTLFFREAEGYRQAFDDKSYFLISALSRRYYFNDRKSKYSERPRYSLNVKAPNDAWFFSTMRGTKAFNINVDPDVKLNVTKIWFNVLVKDKGRNIGLAGTGLDLSAFLNRFISNAEAGVTPLILNREGSIQAHPNRKLIDYASVNDKGANHSTIYKILPRRADHKRVEEALARAAKNPDKAELFSIELDGAPKLCAVSAIPELDWFVVTAVDLKAARVLDSRLFTVPLLIGAALLVLLLLSIIGAVNHLLLTPLFKLTNSARAVAKGDYAIELPPAGNDELGALTRAFGTMAAEVRSNTEQLESRVQERTRELVSLNAQMSVANKQIGDSIQYASLIQNSILPDREMDRILGENYFVLWQPRDVVGGDFYVFRAFENGCLMGVVDCAGHGVPGALMTMIAHAILNVVIDEKGAQDPALVLSQLDMRLRAMLMSDEINETERPQSSQRVMTHMDVGLAAVDFGAQTVTFAGAKTSLFYSDGEDVTEVKGDRYAVGGKRTPTFVNKTVPLSPKATWYLSTDGLLDQAGGERGFSFGQKRFDELLRRHAQRGFNEQKDAFAEELAAYQGDLAQRDDITVLSFRFR